MADQDQAKDNASRSKTAKKTSKRRASHKTVHAAPGKATKATQIQVSADQLPRRSLEQALRVAKAMRETLAGGPATWEDIASAMEIKPSPPKQIFSLVSAGLQPRHS
jgi:hypothetical protein